MKKTLYIFLIVLITLALVGGFLLIVQYLKPTASNIQTPPANSYPNNSTTVTQNPSIPTGPEATAKILLLSGKSLLVKDFINNHETVPDTVNPGYYYLAGSIGYCLGDGTCPSGYKNDDFSVTYHDKDGHFNIVLLMEPLGKSRAEAEVFLLNRLGITEAQLCNINYWMGTTEQVNTIYAGKNLGFSFCPGATIIP